MSAKSETLSPTDIYAIHSNEVRTGNAVHFDVRQAAVVQQSGLIENVNNIPLEFLHEDHLPADKSIKIIFSCEDGSEAPKAAEKALTYGHQHVVTMDGGFLKWQSLGLPHIKNPLWTQPIVKCLHDSTTGTCQYIVFCNETKDAAVIDPVLDFDNVSWKATTQNADSILDFCKRHKLTVRFILETHAHADHLTASQYLKSKLTGAPQVCIGAIMPQVQKTYADIFNIDESEFKPDGKQFDRLFEDGEEFVLGTYTCKALHVPGHTPDHMCYQIADCIFTNFHA